MTSVSSLQGALEQVDSAMRELMACRDRLGRSADGAQQGQLAADIDAALQRLANLHSMLTAQRGYAASVSSNSRLAQWVAAAGAAAAGAGLAQPTSAGTDGGASRVAEAHARALAGAAAVGGL